MAANGLESLIPKKNQQAPQAHGAAYDADSAPYSSEDAVFVREERESLGVLSSFSSPVPREPVPHETPFSVEHDHDFGADEPVFDGGGSRRNQQVPLPHAEEGNRRDIPVLSGPIFHIELDKIVINPYQPRKEFDDEALHELAASIREFGILQPLVVSKMEEETDFGTTVTYQLIAGHRRLLASGIAGLKTVPVVVRNALKKTEALEMAIVENIQRRDLNVIETARAYARLSDEFGLTQREIAARLGKSRESVANTLRLLSLPTTIQDALSAGKINESHARLLMQTQDQGRQEALFQDIIRNNLSVRDIKRKMQPAAPHAAAGDTHQTSGQERPSTNSLELKQLERDLSETLGAPVHVELSTNGGKIIIHFYSSEEALGIAQKIRKQEV